MGDNTKISWTDATWSPTTGCSRVSPGCDACYAERMTRRLAHQPAYHGVIDENGWTGRVNEVPDRLDVPLRWARPRMIFVDSMSDLFHDGVSDAFIARVFATMGLAGQHTFQVLTKRPQRMARLLASDGFAARWFEARDELAAQPDMQRKADRGEVNLAVRWPLPNAWFGTSIESDRYTFRAFHLRRTPAAVRFLSVEPMIARVTPTDLLLDGIDWVIVGGESGPGARPMDPAWARDLVAGCQDRGIAVHFKQAGKVLGESWGCPDSHGADSAHYPPWARVRSYPEVIR